MGGLAFAQLTTAFRCQPAQGHVFSYMVIIADFVIMSTLLIGGVLSFVPFGAHSQLRPLTPCRWVGYFANDHLPQKSYPFLFEVFFLMPYYMQT